MITWMREHSRDISLFVAGWCALAAIQDIIIENYVWAVINSALAVLNIWLARK